MNRFASLVAALGIAALSQQGFAQSKADVTYECQGGKQVKVHYAFNKQGVPTSASVKLQGKSRKLAYNLDRSNNENTYFTDAKGYEIGAEYLDSANYGEAGMMIFSPKSEILYKACMPKKPATPEGAHPIPDAGKVTKRGSVQYQCQNDRRLKVEYGFNDAGVPVHATLKLDGKNRTLRYDLNYSTDVDVRFADKGYQLDTGYMDAGNFREQSVMVMNAKSEFLYKGCSPVR